MFKITLSLLSATALSIFIGGTAPAWAVPSSPPVINTFEPFDSCPSSCTLLTGTPPSYETSANTPITFEVEYTNGSTSLEYWRIDYGVGDGWLEMIASASPLTGSYTYTSPGDYTVSVAISNKADGGKGNYSSSNFSDSATLMISVTGTTQTESIDITPLEIETSVVPEPGTLALFGLGLAGLGYARRRKAM